MSDAGRVQVFVMAKDDYFKLLSSPKWQRRKTEIQIRDKFTCQYCGAKDETVNVHHRYYEYNKPPWDYADEALILLCESCHEKETQATKDFKLAVRELLEAGFFYLELLAQVNLFKHTNRKK